MDTISRRTRVRRNRLQLLDSAAPQFESFMESREQYITALEETIDLLKRDNVQVSENNLAIRDSISELMAMQQLSNSISTAVDAENIVGTLVHLTRQVMPVIEANVFLFDEQTNGFVPLSSKPPKEFVAEAQKQIESGIVDWVIGEQRTVVFPDLDSMGPKGALNVLVIVPLLLRNETLGMYMIRSPKSHSDVSNQDIQLLTVLANQAAVGVENWRTRELLLAVNNELKVSQAQTMHAAKLAAIGELAASIVHEIKNPIQVLMMHMEMAQRGKPLPNWVELLAQQIKRLSEITRRLMNFSRNVSDETKMEEISVNRAIEETIAIVQHEYRTNRIEIESTLRPDLPCIIGNTNCIQQVMLNLLINARDAMPQGGKITIAVDATAYYVTVKIADTGTGIPKNQLDKIFVPFFTTKDEGQGTGLGLSICRKIMSEHKGDIKVESEIGKGTTFTLFFPIRRKVQ